MTQKLAEIEQDRAVMLAGISHDLRTPLARLRLETELSVASADARADMAADIAQLDVIIDKFLDYARPGSVELGATSIRDVIEACLYSARNSADVQVNLDLPDNLLVCADKVELSRVITNLVENARRYGKSPSNGVTVIDIMAKSTEKWVLLRFRDHGRGVALEQLADLTKPFYRGESARTAANGAGLGLAIVEKTILRMGGAFALSNSSSGGLAATIKLRRAPSNS
jgi:two-component system osmolarity sensor histidine kinase EnvZ